VNISSTPVPAPKSRELTTDAGPARLLGALCAGREAPGFENAGAGADDVPLANPIELNILVGMTGGIGAAAGADAAGAGAAAADTAVAAGPDAGAAADARPDAILAKSSPPPRPHTSLFKTTAVRAAKLVTEYRNFPPTISPTNPDRIEISGAIEPMIPMNKFIPTDGPVICDDLSCSTSPGFNVPTMTKMRRMVAIVLIATAPWISGVLSDIPYSIRPQK
jgi:hypothetical protein